MRIARGLSMLGLVFGMTCGAALAVPDQAYEFAEELLKDGQDAFALLEFQRFAHAYPRDKRAPQALLHAATIRLSYAGDVAGADRLLQRIEQSYAASGVVSQARELRAFLEVNSDFGGKPVVVFIRARVAANRGEAATAVSLYLELAETWPQARLADQALLAAARVQLESLGKPAEARATLKRLAERYPGSALLPEARYQEAVAVETLRGAGSAAAEAYLEVAAAYPDTEIGKRAAAKAAAIAKAANILERTYEKEFVANFEVLRETYTEADLFMITIRVGTDLSQRQVAATLEDALLRFYEKRRQDADKVRVEAYYNYPLTKAGEANWVPGAAPVYTVEKRQTEDVLKDALFDLLKKR